MNNIMELHADFGLKKDDIHDVNIAFLCLELIHKSHLIALLQFYELIN